MLCGQRLGGGQRERPARSDRHDPVVGLDEVAVARQQKRRRLVEHDQHRFEAPQDAIGPPVLGQLDRRALEVAAILLELRFEAREQSERIGRRPGEAGEDAVVVEPADFAARLLDDRLPECDLSVTGHHRAVRVPDRKNRRTVKHRFSLTVTAADRSVKKTGR